MAAEASGDKVAHMCSLRTIVHSPRKSLFYEHFVKEKLKGYLTVKAHTGAAVMD